MSRRKKSNSRRPLQGAAARSHKRRVLWDEAMNAVRRRDEHSVQETLVFLEAIQRTKEKK